jgi:hypothetical protein
VAIVTKREIVALQQSLNQNGFAYQTWARLYEILAEVEADLPVLMWECDTIPIESV